MSWSPILAPGEPFLAEQPGEFDPARDHVLSDDRVAGLHGEGVAEALGVLSRRFEAGQRDRREAILRARLGGEDHAQL